VQSNKRYQILRSLFVDIDDDDVFDADENADAARRANLLEISEILVDQAGSPALQELISLVFTSGASRNMVADDAGQIIEKRLVAIARDAKRKQGDIVRAVDEEINSILAAIAVEVFELDPNDDRLGDYEQSEELRENIRRYLAFMKRQLDVGQMSDAERQVKGELYQLRRAKKEIASQRRAVAKLKEDLEDVLKSSLSEIDRRSRDIESSFSAYREILRDEVTHLGNGVDQLTARQSKDWLEFLTTSKTELLDFSRQLTDGFKVHVSDMKTARADMHSKVAHSIKEMQGYMGSVDDAKARVEALNNSLSITDENLEAFKKAAQERAGQTQSRQHWSRRIRINSIGFAVSAGLLLFFLAIVPVFGFIFSSHVLQFMKAVSSEISSELGSAPNAAQVTMAAVNRVVLIGAPVALYFWLIRILVRYNAMTLAMMDDAHQRRTMIDTYIHLIEHQFAKTEDRAILLNAIFRPSPGQQNDVDPPSFVDLVDRLKPSS
jgi:hypothetical protein